MRRAGARAEDGRGDARSPALGMALCLVVSGPWWVGVAFLLRWWLG